MGWILRRELAQIGFDLSAEVDGQARVGADRCEVIVFQFWNGKELGVSYVQSLLSKKDYFY